MAQQIKDRRVLSPDKDDAQSWNCPPWPTRFYQARDPTRRPNLTCAEGERLLEEIGRCHRLSRNSFYHIKSLMSGIFKHAKRKGVLDVPNPMRDVSVPACAPAGETYACSLEEIQRMLKELPEPARTVVATAAFTGLRKSELRGLTVDDYRDGVLHVSHSVWRRHMLEPKTERSKAAVPVISLPGPDA